MVRQILVSGWLVAFMCAWCISANATPDPHNPQKQTATYHSGPAIFMPVFIDPTPNDTTVSCIDSIPAPVDLMANDGMGGAPFAVSPVDDPDPMTIDACTGGVITRSWSAIVGLDTTTVEQVITVLADNTPPAVLVDTSPDTVACELAQLSAPNNPLRFDTWLNSVSVAVSTNASDDCSGIDDITSVAPSYEGDCHTMIYTFQVTDNCGNITNLSFPYVTIDTIGPQFIGLPPNDTLSCEEMIPDPPMVTVMDNCTPDMVASYTEFSGQVMDGTCGQYEYNILRTWAALDSCGNFNSYTQTIRVIDETPPTYTVPPDITISCNSDPNDLGITGDVTDAMDNCSPSIQVFFTDEIDDGDCIDEYTITRTWRAIDTCGNVSGKIQEITIADLQGPSFTVPVDITVDCNGADELSVTGEPTNLMDDCDPAPAITFSDVVTPGPCPNTYDITRTWRATDRCGNFTEKVQDITVLDDSPPFFDFNPQDLTLDCTDGLDIDQAFADWVMDRAGATGDDNCTNPEDLQWMVFNSGTTDTPSLPAIACPAVGGVIRSQMIDIIMIDECDNRDTATVTFQVLDQAPPMISNCPGDLTIPTDPGLCSGTVTLEPPVIEDDCAAAYTSENLSDTQTVTSQAMPVEEGDIPVDPVTFLLPLTQPLPVNAAGDGMLTISLTSADAEAAEEYFLIYGEGSLIGQTALTPAPCGNSSVSFTIPAAQLNEWSVDGVIEITLEPNIPAELPGRFAINAICDPPTEATADLGFPVKEQGDIIYEYSVNGGMRVLVDPIDAVDVSLDQGSYLIRYFATDCAGNQDSCSFTVMVTDQEPPALVCPADILDEVAADSCEKTLTLPLPVDVTDNCGVFNAYQRTLPATANSALIQFALDPNLNDYLALSKTLLFDNVAANGFGDATLTVDFMGDFNTNGAFIDILGDDGGSLGTTMVGAADCMTAGQLVLTIPEATFNSWAADGQISIQLIPNDITVPPGVLGDGINPCDPMAVNMDGDNDGTSFMTATLTYNNIAPQYYTQGATTISTTTVMAPAIQPTITFNQGVTEVFYLTADLAGNADTCSFNVTIEDNIEPTAICQPTNLFINPSGLQVEVVDASTVDAGSFDNCAIDSTWLLPNVFTCAQTGQTVNVTLFVRDESNNIGTCTTVVGIAPERPMPEANSGLCGGDTLFLIANPPPPGANAYTFEWFDPNDNLISTEENFFLPSIDADDEGPYRVVVTGLSGCTSEGVVFVSIEGLPLTPEIEAPESVCVDESFLLQSPLVPDGNNVTFYWYEGLPPGNLLDSTSVPEYQVTGPHALGATNYYMEVSANGCLSPPSAITEVTAFERPTATVTYADTLVCEGEVINLGALSQTGATYNWTGPNTYSSDMQFPEVGPLADVNGGYYYLTVNRGLCASFPDSTLVTIKPQPEQPQVSNSGPVCTGEPLILTTTSTNASSYTWKSPSGMTITTGIPSFSIPSASASTQGAWTVTIVRNGCTSPESEPTQVIVHPANVASAAAMDNPSCEGEDVILQAFASVPGSTYSWVGPSNYESSVQMPTLPNVTQADAGNYYVTVTSAVGCSDSASVNLTVLESVEITGLSDNLPACIDEGFDVVISPSTFPADDGSYSYAWFRNGMVISSAPQLQLPNVTPADGGSYSLQVTTADGCSSEMVTTTLSLNFTPVQPAAPATVSGITAFCEGASFTLTTTSYSATDIQYFWETPFGSAMTTSNMLIINDANVIDHDGAYRVFVVRDGCPSSFSADQNITINVIPSVEATSNSPVCEGDVISLQTTFYPNGVYSWSGPNNFSSGVFNPLINNADSATHEGLYKVVVSRFGCVSDTASTFVEVRDRPLFPLVDHEAPICLDDPDAVLILTIDSLTATPGATYTWYTNNGATAISDPTSELVFEYIDFDDFAGGGTFNFQARAVLEGCTSSLSDPTAVTFNVIPPNEAFAGMDTTVCSGTYTLEGLAPSVGTGQWSLVSATDPTDFTIANPDDAGTTVSGLSVDGAPYLLQWVLSNGACRDYSADSVVLDVIMAETAFAGEDILACDDEIVILSANPVGEGSTGVWRQGNAQVILGVEILDSLNATTEVTGLVDDNVYFFTWHVSSACGATMDEVLVNISDANVDAGDDMIVCDETATGTLSASQPSLGSTGFWTSLDPTVTINEEESPVTEVSNLKEGDNIFVWEVDEGFCGDASRDTVIIQYKLPPDLQDDQVSVAFGMDAVVMPFQNDLVPVNTSVGLNGTPGRGTASVVNANTVQYSPPANFVGTDELEYIAISEGCPETTALITFIIGEGAACVPPSIFTPNNDGVNDNFVVPCLLDTDRFPRSQVIIFNRWGDEVFRSQTPYQSTWNGTYDGEDLPVDTYFYIIDLGDGSEPLSGYVMIQR